MSRLDGEAKKTSANILHSLLESAKASTEKQIHTDEPAEAPKETKEALITKTQKPEVPHKEHIVESEELIEADGLAAEKISQLQDQIADLQAYLDETPEVPEDERTSIQAEIDEMLDEINYYENGLEEGCSNKKELTENITNKDGYSLTGDVNGYKIVDKDDNVYRDLGKISKEQALADFDETFNEAEQLTEAPNPENADINKKILNTIKTKGEVEPKYKKDLEDLGLKVVNQYGEWNVEGPNGKNLSKYDITGGQNAHFNPEERKHADYYNFLTKDYDKDKNGYYSRMHRRYKPTQERDTRYNYDTKEYEPYTHYGNKYYNDRQERSQGYDFNDLRYGSKDIEKYKDADEKEKSNAPGSWSQDYDQRRIDNAKKELEDFQASISNKIKELQDRIKWAEDTKLQGQQEYERAKQTKQDILNKHRETRNK